MKNSFLKEIQCKCPDATCSCKGKCGKKSRHTVYLKVNGISYEVCSICCNFLLDLGDYDIFAPVKPNK